MRRYGRPSYINSLEHQFPGLRRASDRFSSVEDSPPPPLPMKRTSVALDDIAVSSTSPFVHPPQASSPITTSTRAGSPLSLETADEAGREQPVDVPEPVTVNMQYTTKLAGKLAEKRRGTQVSILSPVAQYIHTYTQSHTVTDIYRHTPVLLYLLPITDHVTFQRKEHNYKSKPLHCQCTSGLLAMIMSQLHGNQRTYCNSSSDMCT